MILQRHRAQIIFHAAGEEVAKDVIAVSVGWNFSDHIAQACSLQIEICGWNGRYATKCGFVGPALH